MAADADVSSLRNNSDGGGIITATASSLLDLHVFIHEWVFSSATSAPPLLSPAPCLTGCQWKGQPSFSQNKAGVSCRRILPGVSKRIHKNSTAEHEEEGCWPRDKNDTHLQQDVIHAVFLLVKLQKQGVLSSVTLPPSLDCGLREKSEPLLFLTGFWKLPMSQQEIQACPRPQDRRRPCVQHSWRLSVWLP